MNLNDLLKILRKKKISDLWFVDKKGFLLKNFEIEVITKIKNINNGQCFKVYFHFVLAIPIKPALLVRIVTAGKEPCILSYFIKIAS